MLFDPAAVTSRYFSSYVGTALPLRLVGSLDGLEMDHRNTYVRAYYNAADQLLGFEKWVYGEIQLIHRYGWRKDGRIAWAEVTIPEEETSRVEFDETGVPSAPSIMALE